MPALVVALLLSVLMPSGLTDPTDNIAERMAALTPLERDEVMWLARCIYSESDLPHEQRLVAWVVRNRVETEYRGTTYREVVLEPMQFSAFNTATPRRERILKLDVQSKSATWRRALGIAIDVFESHGLGRPFSIETRHFYSPVSMVGRTQPPWAANAVSLDSEALGVDPKRFLFFERIDEEQDPYLIQQTPALQDRPSTEARVAEKKATIQERRTRLRRSIRFSGQVQRPARPARMPVPRKQQ